MGRRSSVEGMTRLRSVRIDLAPSLYEKAEGLANEEDIGVEDLMRRVFIEWLRGKPDLPAS